MLFKKRFVRKIKLQEERVRALKIAESMYQNSYYTDQLIEAKIKLVALQHKWWLKN